MTIIVLRFDVEFVCGLHIIKLSPDELVDIYREITDHIAYHVFSLYLYPIIINLLLAYLGVWIGTFVLITPFPDHCLLLPF